MKQPGQVFAKMAMMMDKCIYPVSAESISNTELLAFGFRTFRKILQESRETCFQFMMDMCNCLQQYMEQVDYLTLQNASFRLINYLLQQSPENHDANTSYEVKLKAPKSIIASCLSIQPETFSRILRNLKNQNLIKVNGKTIVLLNIRQLRKATA
ncbi:MAG: Crp/Fnr family transcriptional regulator [Gammaproteobacteria bacterium]|nr:MAG: Crp/Fnr family transcriptional regulator [Gammaproteobacteria bacterium]